MKFPIWKNVVSYVVVAVCTLVIVGIFFVILAILYAPIIWFLVILCCIAALLCFVEYGKILFCYIIINDQGVQRIYKGKQITFFNWEDVFEIRKVLVHSRSGRVPIQDIPVIMIARRNITYDDKKHITNIIIKCNNISIIALIYTKELENEIKKYYTKDIETEKFH